jgi:thiamine kinase-like enzyme
MLTLLQDPRLRAIRNQIPLLSSAWNITALGGGLTNRNYRVDTSEGTYVLRIGDPASGILGINREDELVNTARAHQAGVGAALVASLSDENVLVIEWLEARTLHANQIQSEPDLISRIALALRQLHQGPAFQGHFHFPALRKKYLKTVLESGYFLPDQYLKLEPCVTELEKWMEVKPEPLVACNNDLLAENFLDDGMKIWIIDYEFAGQNEASFDLGNLAGESFLDETQITRLCDSYWQEHLPEKIVRAKAWSLIARYGWVLWSSIQEGISTIDFDFRNWGMKKWNSVLPQLQGNHYSDLLEMLKQSHS